jgi:anaerobic selenocysteine-containing dehydrogenase
MPEPSERQHVRTCPFCEATCGLLVTTRGRDVTEVRGNPDDVFSRGYICPKAYALKELDADPDRLRTPLVRRGGRWHPVSFDEAFAEIDRRLVPIVREHGRDAVAIYAGNSSAHTLSLILYLRVLARALGTKNFYSASTIDQMPKQVAAGLMFGTAVSIPVPDVDRTQYLLVLGADPLTSNGSLMTAPGMSRRLRALRERGGRLVVIDPRRSRTAEVADEHHFIRPGTDAFFLFGLLHTLVVEERIAPGRLAEHVHGVETVCALARDFAPELVAARCGIAADTIRRIARDLAAAPAAAVYGRIGTCTQEFGALASWLVDVLNVVTGNLDRAGGAMFTRPATGAIHTAGTPGRGKGVRFGRRRSRVRGLPEVFGEFPIACLAEEIETPGEGQVRALITVAGNPALSSPNGDRLARAFASLDFMISFDVYLNETTRHAHVILPNVSPLEQSHCDVLLRMFAVRNVAHWSPAVFAPPPGQHAEWRSIVRLVGILMGQGPDADVEAVDDLIMRQRMESALADPTSPAHGRSADEVLAALAPRRGPERVVDFLLRSGPWGDGFGARPDGLSLARLEASPNGIDLGPLAPRIPDVLRTPSGKVELAPEAIVADCARLRAALEAPPPAMVLVGRRTLRSKNSWMHNLPSLVKGPLRCTLHVHPTDAARIGLRDGGTARVTSRVGALDVTVQVTDAVMPGVVSLPHGWGHDAAGARLGVAAAHAGVNTNVLADDLLLEPLSGNAVLCGLPVTVAAA